MHVAIWQPNCKEYNTQPSPSETAVPSCDQPLTLHVLETKSFNPM
jgi:hypothetical protein